MDDSSDSDKEQMKPKHRNISASILHKKKMNVGDPLNQFGIMTLNNQIPYKKPILKQAPVFVNARGIIYELE